MDNKNSFISQLPVPCCVVAVDGLVKAANSKMKNVFAYEDIAGSNFFALTGVRRKELIENHEKADEEILIHRNDNVFELQINGEVGEEEDIVVYFMNVTEREALKASYNDEKICLMYISIDNYDELIQSITTDSKRAVPTEVDRIVRKWINEYDANIEDTGEDEYLITLHARDAKKIIESKFIVLDEVRSIEAKIDFPVSLSIGLGMGPESIKETQELASAALQLALGRGGDQAVVKSGDRTFYYGGKLQSFEKNNKGKSRVISHALKQLIQDSSKVIIMGHVWPDMDCFGSAIGAYRMAKYLGKDAYIVIGEYNEALQVIYEQAIEKEEYAIIKEERAFELVDDKTLLIVVDTNRPSIVESAELLKMIDKKVVIDHHRLPEDAIENPILSYVESYASSASELMTEIIQYTATKRIVNKFEAEALLAGITVDTNSFSIRTGVRTFEAAAWLRRAGADTTEVKRFFQSEVTSFQTKADAVANAEYLDNGVVVATSRGYSTESQIINAQVADELLMVKGVTAAFCVGKNDRHKTVISARSLGEINVQVVMEKFGGGGHLTSAGAQVDISPEDVYEKLKIILPEVLETNRKEDE